MPLVDRHTFDHHPVGGLDLEPKTQIRFAKYLVCALSVSFLLLLVRLSVALKRARDAPNKPSADAISEAIHQQRLWVTEKSRGVSISKGSMSANQVPKSSNMRGDDELSTGDDHRDDDQLEENTISASPLDAGVSPWDIRARPRPPPPLTPPVLSSVPTSNNFFGLPNPDYISVTSNSSLLSGSTSTALDSQHVSPTTPRRRSYTKVVSVGPDQDTHGMETDVSVPLMSSSFPSSSPILPLAPDAAFDTREMDVQGEIISVLDDAGAGWKRHTRVYGGGVCLACLAAEGQEDGGYYGENVPLEDRRH